MMNKSSFFLVLLLLALSQRGMAQRLVTTTRPPATAQRASDDFPGQIRPAEVAAEVVPAPTVAVDGSDLKLSHLQYIKNKVALGMLLTKSETLFVILWMQRFPARARPTQ